MTAKLVVGITGASGAIYAVRFLLHAAQHFEQLLVIASQHALSVARAELGLDIQPDNLCAQSLLGKPYPNIVFLDPKDYFTPPASGSFRHDGMVIIPCSMGTAGRIAHGVSDDLLTRAADVCLKERRKLILVVRETPLNLVHLRTLTTLTEAGAIVLPASPAFYHHPRTVEELVDTVVARVLQQLGIEQRIMPQWQTEE
ncbi:MAG: flavin prenyltransferase UbiX [Armatimonadota bacterium]|nr:UbiX family flavin prenyltransferase [bacterium]MDW8321053.1 flavin prenyltransferase UbiX [Armatimonadota bacterium]